MLYYDAVLKGIFDRDHGGVKCAPASTPARPGIAASTMRRAGHPLDHAGGEKIGMCGIPNIVARRGQSLFDEPAWQAV